MIPAPDPVDPILPAGHPGISAAAERARERLHEEIERVRVGVEEMLAEQGGEGDTELRKELDALREETRRYVKKRVASVRDVEKSMRRSRSAPASWSDASTGSSTIAATPSGGSTPTPRRCSTACCARSAQSPTVRE